MRTKNIFYSLGFLLTLFCGCSNNLDTITENLGEKDVEITTPEVNPVPNTPKDSKILSLGDSYTIGESVCASCRFPEQLKDNLVNKFNKNDSFSLNVIARTGWTTTNLINAIKNENLSTDYDLITLLIGVNNQYQNISFSLYETEFPQLVDMAISKSKGDKSKLIVVSIPDYAFTPFGNGNSNISVAIDRYNNFAKNYCTANNISYVYITDITRLGLIYPELVATDGLHPSELAYSRFVERILPLAIEKLTT